jgi:hypothetical protein
MDVLNSHLAAILLKLEDCEAVLAVMSPPCNLIPSNSGFRLKPDFFEMPNPIPPSQDFELQALNSFVKTKNQEISAFPPPKWATDFGGFLDDLLPKGALRLKQALSYTVPLPDEVDLSRYCFSGGNSQFCAEVDDAIQRLLPDSPTDFVNWALSAAIELIDKHSHGSADDHSVGLLMVFRVIFDRAYEKRRRLWLPNPQDEGRILERASGLPTRFHQFPMPKVTQEELEMPIRSYFKRDRFFAGASEYLSEIVFATNPVDALYSVDRALHLLNKAALLNQLTPKGTAAETDLQKMLAFDDLFSLFVGVALGSDLPEFFEIAAFVSVLAPTKCLSNPFQFAHSALAALSVHFAGLNLDELEAEFAPRAGT